MLMGMPISDELILTDNITEQDVKDGVIATRIGAYVGDMAKGVHNGEKDLIMANARKDLDWEAQYAAAMCPEDARAKRDQRPPEDSDTCTMCGDFCAIKIVNANAINASSP